MIERFSYILEMKTREQNRNNKRTEIERFDWFIKRIQTRVAFSWSSKRSGEKTSCPIELARNQLILRFDVILQHVWPIDQCFLNTRIFFGGKTKSSCSYPIIHWLIKQITNTHRNHFSRSHKNRSNAFVFLFFSINPCRCWSGDWQRSKKSAWVHLPLWHSPLVHIR